MILRISATYWGVRHFVAVLTAHALTTWRFWQVLRKSRRMGWCESVAAGSHLMLTRAMKAKPSMTIPTYDPEQVRIQIVVARRGPE